MKRVALSRKAEKQLLKVPLHIANKLMLWVDNIEEKGIEEVRKIKGYNDEPLSGKLSGYRSIRLNKAYRVIYYVNHIGFVVVEEVNKHEY